MKRSYPSWGSHSGVCCNSSEYKRRLQRRIKNLSSLLRYCAPGAVLSYLKDTICTWSGMPWGLVFEKQLPEDLKIKINSSSWDARLRVGVILKDLTYGWSAIFGASNISTWYNKSNCFKSRDSACVRGMKVLWPDIVPDNSISLHMPMSSDF
jgi:hypothetical protein